VLLGIQFDYAFYFLKREYACRTKGPVNIHGS
jgi:hypothetical protein